MLGKGLPVLLSTLLLSFPRCFTADEGDELDFTPGNPTLVLECRASEMPQWEFISFKGSSAEKALEKITCLRILEHSFEATRNLDPRRCLQYDAPNSCPHPFFVSQVSSSYF